MNQNELEIYVKKLNEQNNNLNGTIDEMDKKINQLLATGQEPTCQLIYFEPYMDPSIVYSDEFVPLIDTLKGAYLTNCKNGSYYYPEMMLPLPVCSDIETHNFLTPFPFTVEMPVLNPTFKTKELLVDILEEAGKADSNKLKVT